MKLNKPLLSTILFESKALADGYHPVMLRITYRRQRKYYSIEGLKAHPSEWNEGDSRKAISGRFKGKEAPEKTGVCKSGRLRPVIF